MTTFSQWTTAKKSKEEWNSWQEVEGSNIVIPNVIPVALSCCQDGCVRNCSISVQLITACESENWARLPNNSIYVNYNLCENFNTNKNWYWIFGYTQCVSLGKADDETRQHTLYSLQSQTSNYNYVHWYINSSISEVLAVFTFRLFF